MGVGLEYPRDLAQWQSWQLRQRGLKARIKDRLDRLPWHGRPPIRITSTADAGCDLLVTLDATTPTAVLALLRPLEHLSSLSIRIASTESIADIVPGGHWREGHADIDAVTVLGMRAKVVLSTGHFLPLGAAALRGITASRAGNRAAFLTVQHGLLTPKAPPLASGTHLLAWSEDDADYWRSGRDDVTSTVVGSQLFWEAAQQPMTSQPPSKRPVFLGQLHGAELDRYALAASTEQFCHENHAIYRPHPAERDRRSRAWHRKWEAAGIEIDSGARRLAEVDAPVVSAFSTGILEAAARGLPAWAYHANPPAWLAEFWNRYGMHRWGEGPTPAPLRPPIEPAQAIASIIIAAADGLGRSS